VNNLRDERRWNLYNFHLIGVQALLSACLVAQMDGHLPVHKERLLASQKLCGYSSAQIRRIFPTARGRRRWVAPLVALGSHRCTTSALLSLSWPARLPLPMSFTSEPCGLDT